jgi:hypothetical protein
MRRILCCMGGVALLVGACASAPSPLPPSQVPPSASIAATSAGAPTPAASPSSPAPSPTAPPTPLPSGASADRYADGIPKAVDGEPVLRGASALARAASATDTTPFLIGGWATYEPGVRSCTVGSVGPNTPWSRDCVQAWFSDVAGALDPKLTAAVTFHFALAGLAGGGGPVVARVEVHDPRSSYCGTAAAVCDRMMAVQQVVWAGDAGTSPRPISVDAAARALASVQRGAALAQLGPSSLISDCGWVFPAAQVELVQGTDGLAPRATIVELEPSTAARQRAIPQRDGAAGAFLPSALVCADYAGASGSTSLTDYRWLVVDNVVAMVRVHAAVPAADRTFVDRLSAALAKAASTNP